MSIKSIIESILHGAHTRGDTSPDGLMWAAIGYRSCNYPGEPTALDLVTGGVTLFQVFPDDDPTWALYVGLGNDGVYVMWTDWPIDPTISVGAGFIPENARGPEDATIILDFDICDLPWGERLISQCDRTPKAADMLYDELRKMYSANKSAALAGIAAHYAGTLTGPLEPKACLSEEAQSLVWRLSYPSEQIVKRQSPSWGAWRARTHGGSFIFIGQCEYCALFFLVDDGPLLEVHELPAAIADLGPNLWYQPIDAESDPDIMERLDKGLEQNPDARAAAVRRLAQIAPGEQWMTRTESA